MRLKTAANYAASIYAAEEAKHLGYTQVLWLDAVEHRISGRGRDHEHHGKIGDEIITPPLGGSILPGVTRDSVLTLCRDWGLKVSERHIPSTT